MSENPYQTPREVEGLEVQASDSDHDPLFEVATAGVTLLSSIATVIALAALMAALAASVLGWIR